MSEYHTPVMLSESISALVTNPEGIYADATFGGGGHTAELLSRLHDGGRVIAFDRDSDALLVKPDDSRLVLIHNNFRFIRNYQLLLGRECSPSSSGTVILNGDMTGLERISDGFDGILADLGVSSHQFDTAERGFSFRWGADLDMRMNTEGGKTAADVLNSSSEADLERILRLYGEVEGAGRIAKMIVSARANKEIRTTGDLHDAIENALPSFQEHKVLAKIYQALRIEVNDEMRSLEKFLEGAVEALKDGGRLVVITYHSLEDRMVKNFIKTGNVEGIEEKDIYGRVNTPLSAVNRKPILPKEEEIASNTRARSAKLRIAEKIYTGRMAK